MISVVRYMWGSKIASVTPFFPLGNCYNGGMDIDIETVSVDMSQSNVKEQSAAQVQSLSLDKEEPVPVDTLSSVQTITDPNLGQTVNILD